MYVHSDSESAPTWHPPSSVYKGRVFLPPNPTLGFHCSKPDLSKAKATTALAGSLPASMEGCDTAKVLKASAVDGADSAAAASKQQDAEKQPNQANNQAEEEAAPAPVPVPAPARVDAFASDSEEDDEDDDAMSSLEYILTYKELPQFEVDLILSRPVKRTPFADSEVFKHLFAAANPSTTQEEIDKARDEYEENLNTRARFHEYVRSEYEAKGYVAVSDEYIDRRVYVEEFSRKLWEGFSVSGRERGD